VGGLVGRGIRRCESQEGDAIQYQEPWEYLMLVFLASVAWRTGNGRRPLHESCRAELPDVTFDELAESRIYILL